MKVQSMATHKDHGDSGNDGSWFLEAVGALPPSLTPSEAVAALELDNTLPDIGATAPSDSPTGSTSVFDGSTGTSTSTFEPARGDLPDGPDTTGELEILVSPSSAAGDDDAGLSPVLRTRRSFRWPAAVFVVFFIVAVALAILWLPVALRHDTIAVKQTYADNALALRQHMPSAQAALDGITSPETTSEELSSTVPIISQLAHTSTPAQQRRHHTRAPQEHRTDPRGASIRDRTPSRVFLCLSHDDPAPSHDRRPTDCGRRPDHQLPQRVPGILARR